jgi:hypothetical protein
MQDDVNESNEERLKQDKEVKQNLLKSVNFLQGEHGKLKDEVTTIQHVLNDT